MYSQWGYEFGGAKFTGRILSLSLQDMPLQDGRLPQDSLLRLLLARSDTMRLVTSFVSGPIQDSLVTQIVSIIGGQQTEFVGVWQRIRDLHARVQLQTSNAWLRNPWVGLAGGLQANAGDTVRIRVTATKREILLAVSRDGRVLENRVPLTPDLFWAGFLPWEFVAGLDPWWLPLLPALPTLVLLGLATHRRVLLATLALSAALLLRPLLAGISLPAWPVAVAGILAVALGIWLGHWLMLCGDERAPGAPRIP